MKRNNLHTGRIIKFVILFILFTFGGAYFAIGQQLGDVNESG